MKKKLDPEYMILRARKKLLNKCAQNENGCFVWSGKTNPGGYGKMRLMQEQLAHRVSWVVTNGPIPEGRDVLHKCDNPPCCNPDHLFLGTDEDNAKDRKNKGRNGKGPGPNTEHWISLRAQVLKKKAEGARTVEVARELGIAERVVSVISRRGSK